MIFQLTSGPLLEPTEGSPHATRSTSTATTSSRPLSAQFLAFRFLSYFRFLRFYS